MRTTWTWPTVACIALAGTLWMVKDDLLAAARAPTGPVAVVDVGRLFNECQQTKDIDEMLQQIQADVRGKATKKQEAFDQAKSVLNEYNPNSAEARAQAHKAARLRVDLEAFGTMVQQDIARERKNWTIDTYTKIEQAIDEIAKARGATIVLSYHPAELQGNDTAAIRREIILREVLYRADQTDLTNDVLTLLNKRYAAAGGRSGIRLYVGPQD